MNPVAVHLELIHGPFDGHKTRIVVQEAPQDVFVEEIVDVWAPPQNMGVVNSQPSKIVLDAGPGGKRVRYSLVGKNKERFVYRCSPQ